MPTDLSTAVLIDEEGIHRDSAAVLRPLAHLGFPWIILGRLFLFVPKVIRDTAYQAFGRNRGKIWKVVKLVTGMGDTLMDPYKDRILGLEEPLDAGWGFSCNSTNEEEAKSS